MAAVGLSVRGALNVECMKRAERITFFVVESEFALKEAFGNRSFGFLGSDSLSALAPLPKNDCG